MKEVQFLTDVYLKGKMYKQGIKNKFDDKLADTLINKGTVKEVEEVKEKPKRKRKS